MHLKSLSLLVILLGACTAGPSSPGEYSPYNYGQSSVTVHVRFVDPPAMEGSNAYANLGALYVKRPNDLSPPQTVGGTLSQENVAGARTPLQAGDLPFELVSALVSDLAPDTSYPNIRFFSLYGWLSSSSQETSSSTISISNIYVSGPFAQPGLLLVYAAQATVWSLFAPGSPTVTFPQGYSWLRRTCSAGQVQIEVRPIEEIVEFRPLDSGSRPSNVQMSEERFVESCRATAPAVDPGTCVSFDRAGSLAWSPDNTALYYLSVGDADAPTRLRQIRLTDLASSELASVPNGAGLQVDGTGTLFVSNLDHLLRASSPATPPVTLTSLPAPSSARVSPDGRWLSYSGSDGYLHIWDVRAGADLGAVPGSYFYATWSPDSLLAYWAAPDASSALSLHTLAPVELGVASPQTYPFATTLPNTDLTWTREGPLVAKRPFDFPPSETHQPCRGCVGLSLIDPATGVERAVLDGSVGLVSVVPTAAVLDALFAWTTNCLGPYDTSCSHVLLRVNLTAATAETVVTSTKILPIAVSSDGHRVAFSRSDGIYVKDLP